MNNISNTLLIGSGEVPVVSAGGGHGLDEGLVVVVQVPVGGGALQRYGRAIFRGS